MTFLRRASRIPRQADRHVDDASFEARHRTENDQFTSLMVQQLFDRLVSSNLIRQADLERTYRAARETSQRPDRVIVDLGLIAEAELFRQLGLLTGSALATDDLFPDSPICPELVTKEFARFSRIIPVRHDGDELVIARVDPFDDEPCRSLEFLTGLPVKALLIDNTSFSRHFAAIYENSESPRGEEDERAGVADDGDIERLRGIASEAPIVKLVNEVIGEAISLQASDIHFESSVDGIEIRLRIDGKLELLRTIPSGLRAAITSRLKIMAKLDIAERRLPQDGRIKVLSRGTGLDLRVSSIPTAYGECIVLRILDQSRVELNFSKLGFRSELIDGLGRLTARPNGILLVAGPTGSGKTTTLYTALSNIDTATAKVISVEDPVEYQLRGISQIQIHPSIGLSFPQTLRSILRQDPDVIMVGEIRDAETAAIAMQASLTGHLVLSTLHTNSAISSISRLTDMGLERFLIASTLEGVLSQRLVRRLCPDCAVPHPDRERLADEFRLRMQDDSPKTPPRICTPVGCASCRGSGYRGRLSIAELFVMSEEHRSLICQGAPEKEIQKEARRQGMVDIHQDGLQKIWNGLTSLPEVLAVAGPLL